MLMNKEPDRQKYIANKIIALRRSVYWSQAELARQAGVSIPTLCIIEKADRMPSLTNSIKLAKALRVPLSDLINDSPSLPNEEEAEIFFRKWKKLNELNSCEQQMISSNIKWLIASKKRTIADSKVKI